LALAEALFDLQLAFSLFFDIPDGLGFVASLFA
jgi:hypothetical protein